MVQKVFVGEILQSEETDGSEEQRTQRNAINVTSDNKDLVNEGQEYDERCILPNHQNSQ